MFKGQPKGFYTLALANTGERFGFYTMLAIFALFLQAKFGFSAVTTSNIFAGFLALVYFLPLFGGILADKFGYNRMVTIGIVVMFLGYVLLTLPFFGQSGIVTMLGALLLIAIGTGLFKGNLQVIIGNLYDVPEYQSKRDSAFSIFYMAINLGAMFAPMAATKVTEYFMAKSGLVYNGTIPALCHNFLDGDLSVSQQLTELAQQQLAFTGDLTMFAELYIRKLSESYHWGFAVACFSMVFSIVIYAFSFFVVKQKKQQVKQTKEAKLVQQELTPEQTKKRITALMLVFAVVIFFWMAFSQSGLTLTFFARDYTTSYAEGFTRIGFDIWNLVLLTIAIYSTFAIFQSEKRVYKLLAAVITIVSILGVWIRYSALGDKRIDILPQTFQQFNPFFVVALTPIFVNLFSALAKRGKEPSAPKKIGIGMFIGACGFLVMAIGSVGLPTPNALNSGAIFEKVSPNLLIYSYLVITFAELFLSPMGTSFVSRVAPPKLKGAMMGCWFAASAIGNYLVSIIGMLWGDIPLWILWGILIVLCLISALFIFAIMKRLESVTEE